MKNPTIDIDHLFRKQYGKMVSILTRMIGLYNLSMAEDSVQDTFIKAMSSWQMKGVPDNPEAWLMKAAKNRSIDLIRKIKSEHKRESLFVNGASSLGIEELFLETEIEDSVLRMIFTACHPALKQKDQLAFALKTISGFSSSEIATALLSTQESIKKSLQRARKSIQENGLKFEIPQGQELQDRLSRVHQVLYLIFNEGYQSTHKEHLIRYELCEEAMRLTKIVTDHKYCSNDESLAVMALMCFHSARIETKVSADNKIIPFADQDRSKWLQPLFYLGNNYMARAVESGNYSSYHYEAAIASEHLRAASVEVTDWQQISIWYDQLYRLHPSPMIELNQAIVQLQLKNYDEAKSILDRIMPKTLAKRSYLYYSALAEYHKLTFQKEAAIDDLLMAISCTSNKQEKEFLCAKIQELN